MLYVAPSQMLSPHEIQRYSVQYIAANTETHRRVKSQFHQQLFLSSALGWSPLLRPTMCIIPLRKVPNPTPHSVDANKLRQTSN